MKLPLRRPVKATDAVDSPKTLLESWSSNLAIGVSEKETNEKRSKLYETTVKVNWEK